MTLYTLDELGHMAILNLGYGKAAYHEALIQTKKAMRRILSMHNATRIDEDDLLDFSKDREMKYDGYGNIIC